MALVLSPPSACALAIYHSQRFGHAYRLLRLEDFDWRNETFTVRRAKRGGIQQYPIQFEVGEAVLEYLQNGRPHCVCRNVFVTLQLPYRPIRAPAMWSIVKRRMDKTDIACKHTGPHSLRHACATHLLSKGSSLQEIADFLGHQDTRSVGIYAKYDKRSLRKVAAFSLAGIRNINSCSDSLNSG